jgi:polyisoprenoid-binding protein YceI
LTVINIYVTVPNRIDPKRVKEQVMPIAARRETRNPTLDTPPALAGSWLVDPQASHAAFLAGTLAGLVKTAGRFRALSGSLDVGQAGAAGLLIIDASSIDTGNRMRDHHLRSRDFFHVKRHPHLRYEAHAISGRERDSARIEGELIVAGTRTALPLDVRLDAAAEGVVELSCQTEVDRVALGIRGARAMVPRTVELEIAITLRRASA